MREPPSTKTVAADRPGPGRDTPRQPARDSVRCPVPPGKSGPWDPGQWEILEGIARGASLDELLFSIVGLVERQADQMLCTILRLDPDGKHLRHGAAPRLPPELVRLVDGLPIGPTEGCCGAAAFRRETVIATDIEKDPSFAGHREAFLAHGLVACWSTPIVAPLGHVLGTLAMYYREKRPPTADERAWVDGATYLAAIALMRAETERENERLLSELKNANQRLTIQVSRMPLAYIAWDREFKVTEWNQAAERIFGWSAEEAIGRRGYDLIVPSGTGAGTDPLREEMTHGDRSGGRGSHENVRKDGRHLVCEWFHAPLRDASGDVVGYLSMADDVTERKRAEEERQKLEVHLRQAQRIQSLGTLAGGIAHDFNNILTAITGHTHLALTDLEEERSTKDSLVAIQEAALRAVELVRRILTFSKHQEPERKVVPSRPLVEEAIALLHATLRTRIQVECTFDDNAPAVNVDASQMHQVIMNLCSNAAHASGNKGVIRVAVDSVTAGAEELTTMAGARFARYARFTVSDTGTGMDEATLERIFEPFFTTKPTGQGTGLGLAVVQRIVKAHDGLVSARSQLGAGSTFHVYLPEANARLQAATPPAGTIKNETSRGVRVLYVDDEEPLVVLATRWLGRLGHHVSGFSDSTLALEAFRARPMDFDAVISDFSMPGLSGPDLVRRILEIRPDIVVVMSSGYLRPEDQKIARDIGASDVVSKPQSMAEFGRILHRILSERSARSPRPEAREPQLP
jgi:PAS domain S-box-containing protein